MNECIEDHRAEQGTSERAYCDGWLVRIASVQMALTTEAHSNIPVAASVKTEDNIAETDTGNYAVAPITTPLGAEKISFEQRRPTHTSGEHSTDFHQDFHLLSACIAAIKHPTREITKRDSHSDAQLNLTELIRGSLKYGTIVHEG